MQTTRERVFQKEGLEGRARWGRGREEGMRGFGDTGGSCAGLSFCRKDHGSTAAWDRKSLGGFSKAVASLEVHSRHPVELSCGRQEWRLGASEEAPASSVGDRDGLGHPFGDSRDGEEKRCSFRHR